MQIIRQRNYHVLNWRLMTAFEAVGKHRSFTLAAKELNVQQPAISRRISELERDLGVALIIRSKPRVGLTHEGAILFETLRNSTAQVQATVDTLRRVPNSRTLQVNVTIGFASCYLMKRLPDFQSRHPDISVELLSRDQSEMTEATSDVVIVFEHPANLAGRNAAKIFGETMVAAARPELATLVPDDVTDLTRQPLLHLSSATHADDWRSFFTGTGLRVPDPRPEQKFTSFMVYLQAALDGTGIMLGWETLLDEHFRVGQLQPVTSRRLDTARGYFAYAGPGTQKPELCRRFIDWLVQTPKGRTPATGPHQTIPVP